MVKRPPGRNRLYNSGVSVNLGTLLLRLSEITGWSGDLESLSEARPGEFAGTGPSDTPDRFAINYLFREIMSKFDDESQDSDKAKTDRAMEKFFHAETMCAETNQRVALWRRGFRPNQDVWRSIEIAQRKIESLLGPFDWNEAHEGFTFTNGGSFKLPRVRGAPVHKFSKPETTVGNTPAVHAIFRSVPRLATGLFDEAAPDIEIVPGNRVICVPKNYKTHRTIAAEPSMNMYVQKGIGSMLKRRLRRVGIDLSRQDTNQDWALLGSVTGIVSTIDLSMASDTVSRGIVELLLPPDWLAAMETCRCPKGILPSGEVLYRKFSSMGNAFTFELETLIFWALTRGVCEVVGADGRFVGVYGDDIVCPGRASPLLLEVLKECGFTPNEDKTFVDGPFRESCGKHYFSGFDVSPFYIRSQPKRLSDLFLLVNNLERWRRQMIPLLSEDMDFHLRAFVSELRGLAPRCWRRPRIPDGLGDGAFIGTFDQCLPSRPARKDRRYLGWEGWLVKVLCEVPETWDFFHSGWRVDKAEPHSSQKKGKKKRRAPTPTLTGRLLASLQGLERRKPVRPRPDNAFGVVGPDVAGGIQLPGRYQLIEMLVTQFPAA